VQPISYLYDTAAASFIVLAADCSNSAATAVDSHRRSRRSIAARTRAADTHLPQLHDAVIDVTSTDSRSLALAMCNTNACRQQRL